jgi:hypothetical protein
MQESETLAVEKSEEEERTDASATASLRELTL